MKIKLQKYQYVTVQDESELTDLYKELRIDYPKFYKMDGLSKIGFLCSELLLAKENSRFIPMKDRGVICFNSSSSLHNDTEYQATIQNQENFFPSPSLFVYTLPNILTGEIAIRNKFFGESSFYIMRSFDAEMIYEMVTDAFQDKETCSLLVGWCEYYGAHKEALMFLVSREEGGKDDECFSVALLKKIMKKEKSYKL